MPRVFSLLCKTNLIYRMRLRASGIGKPHGLMKPSYEEPQGSSPEDGDSKAKDLSPRNKALTIYSYNRFNEKDDYVLPARSPGPPSDDQLDYLSYVRAP